MSNFDSYLEEHLQELKDHDLCRSLRHIDSPQGTRIRIDGRELLNFSSNDYLGLANDPRINAAAIDATGKYGTGSGASRLISGSLAPHGDLEEALAQFKRAEAAIVFSSGYATVIGTICALLGSEDIIVLDKLVHASIVDAARLSGAKMRVFTHNDLNELENILKWAQAKPRSDGHPKTLIVTESVFSMDGDLAPLKEIVELKAKYQAWLMVDEAHATGLYGSNGAGAAVEAGLQDHIEVHLGTLGKALGASGGYVCGSRKLVDFLINRARSFIFSTAPMPAAAAAARAAIDVARSSEGNKLREILWQRVAELRSSMSALNLKLMPGRSAILPVIVGEEAAAMDRAKALFARDIFVPAIRYPSVPRGQARLRFTVSAGHTQNDVQVLADALAETQALSSRA